MNSKLTLEISHNIKDTRSRKGLTQVELAKKAGLSANYYARIERGEVRQSLETFEKIVKALNVKSSDILPF